MKPNSNLKSELKSLALISVIIVIIFKIAFYKEPTFNAIKFGLSFLYFSLLPGYCLLLNFRDYLSSQIRVVLSFAIGFAVYAISGYYLNIFIPLNLIIFLPILISLISVLIYISRSKKDKRKEIENKEHPESQPKIRI